MNYLVSLIKKHFKLRVINDSDYNMLIENKKHNRIIKKEEKSNNIQANVAMIYNLNNLTKIEKDIVFYVFNYIFGNGGLTSKLYQEIREKNSLCYGISSYYLKYDSLLAIQISLDNDNVNKAIALVKKCLKEMQNGKFSDNQLNDAINNLITTIDLINDNNISILNNYVFKEYDNMSLMEERKEYLKKVTKKDIKELSKKISLSIIYTLKGKCK